MFLFAPITSRLLTALVSALVLTGTPYAQTTAPKDDTSPAVAPPYASAFEGYKPYTDEPVVNWKSANDTTARIGGWREYAKQAQQPENSPGNSTQPGQATPAPDGKAKP